MRFWPRLPRRLWRQIILRTSGLTLASIIVSLIGSHLILSLFSGGLDMTGVAAAVVMPMLLGTPMIFLLSLKNAELTHAYRRLELSAARDSLTRCLNHGAFVTRASAFLNSRDATDPEGALLVLDADHFKTINDRFGHAAGDVALRQIAGCILGAVGQDGLVGRIGGEEFGVLLPQASMMQAEATAQAIRKAVEAITFETEGTVVNLSVSIGGALFDRPASYSELFRIADKRLYEIKAAGRNNVGMARMPVESAPELLKAS